jgi:hypothetical protein
MEPKLIKFIIKFISKFFETSHIVKDFESTLLIFRDFKNYWNFIQVNLVLLINYMSLSFRILKFNFQLSFFNDHNLTYSSILKNSIRCQKIIKHQITYKLSLNWSIIFNERFYLFQLSIKHDVFVLSLIKTRWHKWY